MMHIETPQQQMDPPPLALDEVNQSAMQDDSTGTLVTESQKPEPKNLVGVFKSVMSPKNLVFIKVMFLVKANPKGPVKTACSHLLEYFKMIQSVDISATLLKWGKENDLDSDAYVQPSALPMTLMVLQSYVDQFWPKPESGDTWCSLHIQFKIDPGDFYLELIEQAHVHKWVTKKHALQTAHTKNVGWILYSLPSIHVNFRMAYINTWICLNFQKDPKKPPPVIGLEHHAIFDGLGKDAQKKMSKDEHWAK